MNFKDINLLQGLSDYRSQLMGVAIIWIMFFHSGIDAPEPFVLRALWYLFVSFGGGIGVDIFFILSGFGLVYSASKLTSDSHWWSWEGKRMIRIIPSYLIVAIATYSIRGGVNLYNILQINFLADGIRDFWFISAIVICYLTFPFLYMLSKKIGMREACGVAMFLSIALYCSIYYFSPEYYKKLEIFLLRIPCFILGVYWGWLCKKKLLKEYIWNIIVSIVVCPFSVYLSFPGSDRWMYFFGTIIFLQILVSLFKIINLRSFHNIFAYFGARSLQIYLVHIGWGFIMARFITNNPNFQLAIYFTASLVVAEMIYQITNPLVQLTKYEQQKNNDAQ